MVEATGLKKNNIKFIFSVVSSIQNFIQNPRIDSKVITGFPFTRLRSLNFRHFGSSMAVPAYQIS
jgi:hypothetical protein